MLSDCRELDLLEVGDVALSSDAGKDERDEKA